MEVQLKYNCGKKKPFIKIGNYEFGKEPVWIPKSDADALTKLNPKMFQRLAERETEKPAPKEPPPRKEPEKKEAKEPLGICEKCSKPFYTQWTYDRHIARCNGPEE